MTKTLKTDNWSVSAQASLGFLSTHCLNSASDYNKLSVGSQASHTTYTKVTKTKMKLIKLLIIIPITIIISSCTGFRVLGIFPLHMKSHFVVFEALMKGLARENHRVDVISPFPQKKPYPNYNDLVTLPPAKVQFINNFTTTQ